MTGALELLTEEGPALRAARAALDTPEFRALGEAYDALVASEAPLLFGVRHHSPVCAAAMAPTLSAFRPERVLVELPADLEEWVTWVGHPDLEPPVALAATLVEGEGMFFYPFASFSPELAAIRWAREHGVPVHAIDLPFGARTQEDKPEGPPEEAESRKPETESWLHALRRTTGADDFESLWDRLVEAPSVGASPEEVRRAALAVGLLHRKDEEAHGVNARDLAREAFMRAEIARHGGYSGTRVVAVVGAFHAPALTTPETDAPSRAQAESAKVRTSLIPYSFNLLDSRSGYPAGIRDPLWHDRIFHALASGHDGAASGDVGQVPAEVVVDVARRMRSFGLNAGLPDAKEALRMAQDLASLRGLRHPGRREVLESLSSTMGHGEPLGRGRMLAKALDPVMVGTRRGRLAPGTPRSGLVLHVEDRLRELGLPGAGSSAEKPTEMVLDPLRSERDRERHVTLERFAAAGVPYANKVDRSLLVDAETLTVRWSLQYSPLVQARIELVAVYGITLEQVAEGVLRESARKLAAAGEQTARSRLSYTASAVACDLRALASDWLRDLAGPFLLEASLPELVDALLLLERIRRGHVPGFPADALPPDVRIEDFLAAAVRSLEGLWGSPQLADAEALYELVRHLEHHPELGDGRLLHLLRQTADEGSPLMQGASLGVLAQLGQVEPEALGHRVGSWVDRASSSDSRSALAASLKGLLVGSSVLIESVPAISGALHARVATLDDASFLYRLPAMREGFEVLSPASRGRLLAAVGDLLGDVRLADTLDHPPELLAQWAAADRAGALSLARSGLQTPDAVSAEAPSEATPQLDAAPVAIAPAQGTHAISPEDRWRLLLGRERERMGTATARLNASLDELYGSGTGEGSAGDLTGGGGGQEHAYPTVREWAEELEALFGTTVREEVLGRAAARGSPAAALELNPDTVRPSVELLEQILSLKGGLGEAQIARLRPLVASIVKQLVDELATRVRPALTGLASARPTFRPTGPLDLRRTIARNLKTARRDGDRLHLVPERFVFRQRARRALDWHVVLVVDVSGSMEPSVIYSALMAAILSGLPAVTVRFFAFNTEVIDLSDHVADPLALLLEVSVGGGTSIGKAVRFARQHLVVPARSLVLVVSDFEEGGSVPELVAEVRGLVESGAKALGLAALDDLGKPRYQRAIAEMLVSAGMPIAALTPLELARWVGEQIR